MILSQTIGLVFAWGFAALLFAAWTGAANGEGTPEILQYGFYGTAGFAFVFTVFFLYQSHRVYVAAGDGYAFIVVRVFQVCSCLVLAGALLAVVFNPGWFFARFLGMGEFERARWLRGTAYLVSFLIIRVVWKKYFTRRSGLGG